MSLEDAMRRAMVHHRAGRLDKASRVYRSILRSVPEHADALHLLGVLEHQRGHFEKAVLLIDLAIAQNAEVALYHCHRAEALREFGDEAAAIAGYRESLRLNATQKTAARRLASLLLERNEAEQAITVLEAALQHAPDSTPLLMSLGNAQRTAGDIAGAESCFRRGLEIDPHDAALHNNLALLLVTDGRTDEAVESLQRAILAEPNHARWRFNLGKVLQDAGDLPGAVVAYRDVLQRFPRKVTVINNLAAALHDQRNYGEAEATYRSGLKIDQQQPELLFGLGNTLRLAGRLDEAAACYEQVLRLDSRHPGALNNAGLAEKFLGRYDESDTYFARLLEVDPDHIDARWNQILTRLLRGEWQEGWPDFDWRWRRPQCPPRRAALPQWDGGSLAGRSLLVYSEQGLGDEVMFASCLSDVIATAEDCVVECDGRLVELFSRSFPTAHFVARREWSDLQWITEQQPLDVQIAAGSLPRFVRGEPDNFPRQDAYLLADSAQSQQWKDRLAQLGDGLKIGISWRGGSDTEPESQQRRSTLLDRWREVLSVAGATFVNVQYGPTADEAADEANDAALRLPAPIHRFAEITPEVDLDEFAALLTALDLVISVDNSTVHLAAALGTTTYAALPFSPDWRWLLDRSDSPWYGPLRLFRQAAPGDWGGVFTNLANALDQLVAPPAGGPAEYDFRSELRAPYFGSIPDVSAEL
jgi:tetratricopeptide (TPR) repeat protein